MDPRAITDELAAVAALPPPRLLPDPILVDRYFSMCKQLYTQGVLSPYVPEVLEDMGGALKLASRDAASIRHAMRDDGWVIDSRNLSRERVEAANRWAGHEAAMRSAIAGGTDVDKAVRDYFERTVQTDPDDYATLKQKVTTGYPSYLKGWQEEIEATKSRVRTVISAPTDSSVGLTIMSVRGLAVGLPETAEGWDEFYTASSNLDAGLGVVADVATARLGSVSAEPPPTPASRRSPVVQAPHVAPIDAPPPGRSVAPPDVGNVFDVRGAGDGGWTGGSIDNPSRGLAEPLAAPAPPAAGRPTTEPVSTNGLSTQSKSSEAVRPLTGVEFEAKLAETDARLRGAPTDVAFSLGEMVKKGTNFNGIVDQLREARQARLAAGHPDPFPTGLEKGHVDGILKQPTIEFILADPRLQAEWKRLYVAIEGLSSPIIRNSAEYKALPVAYRRLGPATKRELQTAFQEFFHGKVGAREPDVVDFWLDNRRSPVVSDATKNIRSLFHNFKTRFYAAVLEKLIGLPVEAWEVGPRESKQLK